MGETMDMTGTPHSYFGTAGSHQLTSAGSADIFLSKFNLLCANAHCEDTGLFCFLKNQRDIDKNNMFH